VTAAAVHIALIASPERWRSERELLRRLAIGLLGEGAAVTVVEPAPERDPESVLPELVRSERRFEVPRRLNYEVRVPFWRREERLNRMVSAFERSMPDLVWAAGADGWDFATQLADACDRPVALELRSDADLKFAPRALRSDRVVALVTPCEPLARVARSIVSEQFVRVVPLGVRVDESLPPRIGPARIIAIIGEGRDERPFAAALRAAHAALERFPELLFLVEFPLGTGSSLWRFARALGMLNRITAVDAAAVGGRLAMTAVSACDVLISTEPHGGPRPEVLAALGRAVPVIAAADPMCDALVDGETALLLPAGETQSVVWTDALLATLDHPDQAREMAARGRALVVARYRSSVAASACLATALDLVRGGPLRFVPAQP